MAIRDEWIIAVSEDPHGLDGLIGPSTKVVERSDLTLLPAFFDTHNHLFEAALNALLVPVDRARSIAEFVDLVRQFARQRLRLPLVSGFARPTHGIRRTWRSDAPQPRRNSTRPRRIIPSSRSVVDTWPA
jgi:predicted amidohydrolase YtcJ